MAAKIPSRHYVLKLKRSQEHSSAKKKFRSSRVKGCSPHLSLHEVPSPVLSRAFTYTSAIRNLTATKLKGIISLAGFLEYTTEMVGVFCFGAKRSPNTFVELRFYASRVKPSKKPCRALRDFKKLNRANILLYYNEL